jgi:hypothetical protein
VVVTDSPVALTDPGQVLGATRNASDGEVLGATRRVHTNDVSMIWLTILFVSALGLGGTLIYGKVNKKDEITE